ncbi:Dor1-like family protein [Histoplasma ohiense]|nr:Dor1-like family protein [Histoplasma ohiense (nom. inval.)]
MADPLYELLAPYFDSVDNRSRPPPPTSDSVTSKYLNYLSTLSLSSLTSTEPRSLSQSSHSALVSLQALSNRSHKSFVTAADHLSSLRFSIPQIATETRRLQHGIPKLDEEAVHFSSIYNKSVENPMLDGRKKAMQLLRNVDRLSDILELPTLLSTAVSSSSANVGTTGASNMNYSSALDLFAHIKRLQTLYPNSSLVKDITRQAEEVMKDMTSNLIAGLRVQNIRLAAAMRTVGWLRRVAPELEDTSNREMPAMNSEGAFGALFLVCRLANLISMLEALDPLRELADQETQRRLQGNGKQISTSTNSNTWPAGQQTERFLKRYIEIYREQSFAIVSMYKNIFAPTPSESTLVSTSVPGLDLRDLSLQTKQGTNLRKTPDLLPCLPPALATFPMHLAQLLTETLKGYLPNVKDKSSRESLLTQVLYCASSLGRLGGNFSMILSFLTEGDEEGDIEDEDVIVPEWEEVMKKHRILSERLDQLTSSGADNGPKIISRVASPLT